MTTRTAANPVNSDADAVMAIYARHSHECLRRQALECAEAETQRHYAIAVAAATERETASRMAVPGQIVLRGVTSTR